MTTPKEALEPFARIPLAHTDDIEDGATVFEYEGGAIHLGDLRRVHKALSQLTASPDREKVAANRIWFDTEFIEDGTTIDLISIGMVRADGATYYAETDQWIPGKASQWVKDNVIIHLKGGDCVKPRDVIAREIVAFAGEKPEFWAYYADYDWVALCQLFGTMMQLPDGWPKFCRDIKQRAVDLGNPKLPEQSGVEHHALADAVWNKQAYDFLSTIAPDEAAIRADEREKCARIADAKSDAVMAEAEAAHEDKNYNLYGRLECQAGDYADLAAAIRSGGTNER